MHLSLIRDQTIQHIYLFFSLRIHWYRFEVMWLDKTWLPVGLMYYVMQFFGMYLWLFPLMWCRIFTLIAIFLHFFATKVLKNAGLVCDWNLCWLFIMLLKMKISNHTYKIVTLIIKPSQVIVICVPAIAPWVLVYSHFYQISEKWQ